MEPKLHTQNFLDAVLLSPVYSTAHRCSKRVKDYYHLARGYYHFANLALLSPEGEKFITDLLASFQVARKRFKRLKAWIANQIVSFYVFTDLLMYRLGCTLTDWLANVLSEEISGDLQEIRHRLIDGEKPNLIVVICLLYEAIVMLWGYFSIQFQNFNSSNEELLLGCYA